MEFEIFLDFWQSFNLCSETVDKNLRNSIVDKSILSLAFLDGENQN